MKRSDVGVGVVGLGGMGRLHAATLRELGAEVVGGADIAGDAREAFAESFETAVYDDHEPLMADPAVDAVVITTPNRFHEPIARAALEVDLDVLVEKPLGHTLESARRIAAASERSAGRCMVGFHNRHSPAARLFDTHRDRGRFGEVEHVEANYVRRRGVPGPGSWFTNPELAGGGALVDVGVHALDLALFALEYPTVVEVSGMTRSTFGTSEGYVDPDGFGDEWGGHEEPYGVEDSVTAFLRCADGRSVVLEAAWATNRRPSTEVVVRGTEAGARFDVGAGNLTVLETGTAGVDHYADVELAAGGADESYRSQDEAFLECVTTDAALETNTVQEALTVQRVVDAIYESDECNGAVRLDESAADERSPTTSRAERT